MSSTVIGNPFTVLKKALVRTAKDQLGVRKAMASSVKDLIKEQFASGIDPRGRSQAVTSRGEPGLQSTKLPNAIQVKPTEAGVEGSGELRTSPKGKAAKRQWLEAHQKGHIFPARQSTGHRIAFNAAGKRVSIAKLKRGAGNTKRVTVGAREAYWREFRRSSKLRGRITNARAHQVGARVLQVRQIYPEGEMGPRWNGRIKTAVAGELQRQLERNVKNGG